MIISYKELKQMPKELRVLLFLLRKNKNEMYLEFKKELDFDINWELFIELSIHHRVFPVVYQRIKDIKNDYIPLHVVQRLRSEYQKNVFRMLQLSGETEGVSKILSDNNIRTIFLKGPVLAAHLYGDVSLRTSADLDILIQIEDLEKTEEILVSLGYVKDDYILSVLNDWKWRHHHITFFHPHKQIKVEIHWRLNPGPGMEPSFNNLWKRRSLSSLTTHPVFMLGNEDLFLFLVTHGARHGWSRLRWLIDISQLIEIRLDWNVIKNLLKKNHYMHVGAQALILTSILLNKRLPNEMMDASNTKKAKRLAEEALFYIKQMVNLHTEPIPKEISIYHKKHLFSLMSFQQKVLFITSFLFPFPEDAQVLPLPKYLHILYFPLRPFLWAWRRSRKQVLQ